MVKEEDMEDKEHVLVECKDNGPSEPGQSASDEGGTSSELLSSINHKLDLLLKANGITEGAE